MSTPTEPTITLVQPALKEPPASSVNYLPAKSDDDFLLPNESLEKPSPQVSSGETKLVEKKATQKKVKQKVAQKKARNKSADETKTETPRKNTENPTVSKVEKGAEKDKSGWEVFKDSVKQGSQRQCSQAEIAMNQCR